MLHEVIQLKNVSLIGNEAFAHKSVYFMCHLSICHLIKKTLRTLSQSHFVVKITV